MVSVSQVPSPVRSDFEFPIPTHLLGALGLLLDLDYSPRAINGALVHLALHKTAEGCGWIDFEHRGLVESTLDRDPAWNLPAWDEYVYAITD